MLSAIANTSLLDDVFREDATTNDLQNYIAELTGHEAALLVMSGTMGNQLAIRTHLKQPPHSVLGDAGSHIMGWYVDTYSLLLSYDEPARLTMLLQYREAGGLAFISQALSLTIKPANNHHLTLADVKAKAVTSKDIHACPTRLICLENTLAGTILPVTSCQEISAWAHAEDPPIMMHCDGARLWEAVASGAGTLEDYCQCFDSVSLCFSKGLGAPIGSMIIGSHAFIERARMLRKPMGGGLRQAGVISAPARVAVEETFVGGKLAATHLRAKHIAELWQSKGGQLQRQCETNMVWFDLDAAGVSKERFVELALEQGVRCMGGRLVVHYQIGDAGVERLAKVMDAVLGTGKENGSSKGAKRKAEEELSKPEME